MPTVPVQQLRAIRRACNLLGSQSALAAILEVSTPTVNQWIKGKRRVPPKQCPPIEKALFGKVKCEQLRPDVDWSYLRGTDKRH